AVRQGDPRQVLEAPCLAPTVADGAEGVQGCRDRVLGTAGIAAEQGGQPLLAQRLGPTLEIARLLEDPDRLRQLDLGPLGVPGTSRGGSQPEQGDRPDRKSTRLNSSHVKNSYAVFCLKKKTKTRRH